MMIQDSLNLNPSKSQKSMANSELSEGDMISVNVKKQLRAMS
jgi:hypothetical protein